MKVVLSAYACEPLKGSECSVGWNIVIQIARFHEVWVITRGNNRESIERSQGNTKNTKIHWIYWDLPKWLRFWKRGQRGIHLYYLLWQIGSYFEVKRLHEEVDFDLAHHITFVNYWLPSFLCFLNVPFVWGPVGGGESAPKAFYKSFNLRGRVYENLRDLVRRTAQWNLISALDARRAMIALATTSETAGILKKLGAKHVKIMSQVALPMKEIEELNLSSNRNSNIYRILSLGRLIHWKGFHLSLMAYAKICKQFPNSEYWFIGDGPNRGELELLKDKLGLSGKVKFCGNIPRQKVFESLLDCDVLVHPSLHESGSLVCLEAMAAAKPVICLDLGGPSLLVTEETGIKIPANNPNQVIKDLMKAMEYLGKNIDIRKQIGNAARSHVRKNFNWDNKGKDILDIYRDVLHEYGKKNDTKYM